MNTPSIGRIVHYSDDQGTACNAAVVTAVIESNAGHVALRVFPAEMLADEWLSDVPYSATPGHIGTWHWPEGTRDHDATQLDSRDRS